MNNTDKQIAKLILDPELFKECERSISKLELAKLITEKGGELAGLIGQVGVLAGGKSSNEKD